MVIQLPWLHCYAGRDWHRGDEWALWLSLFPRRDLMEPREEGCVTLAGLHFDVWVTWREFGRFRPRVSAWWRSDVDEITRRVAERTGHLA